MRLIGRTHTSFTHQRRCTICQFNHSSFVFTSAWQWLPFWATIKHQSKHFKLIREVLHFVTFPFVLPLFFSFQTPTNCFTKVQVPNITSLCPPTLENVNKKTSPQKRCRACPMKAKKVVKTTLAFHYAIPNASSSSSQSSPPKGPYAHIVT